MRPIEFTDFPKELVCTYGPYMAVCEDVIDGDTFYALIDPGFHAYVFASIRIRGINAPELFTGTDRVAGAAARDGLRSLLPSGKPVRLFTERDVQSFNRYIADVELVDGANVGQLMIQHGWAQAAPRG